MSIKKPSQKQAVAHQRGSDSRHLHATTTHDKT